MRVYIIHSPSTSENYIDNVLLVEQKLIENGDHVMNPLPDQASSVGNKELYEMNKHKIKDCDMVYVMKGWPHTCTGNPEMAEALMYSKDIIFEK